MVSFMGVVYHVARVAMSGDDICLVPQARVPSWRLSMKLMEGK